MIRGIDVSENNGEIDWDDIAEAGIKFVMVRSSYGKSGADEMFATNVNGAHEAGLKVGAYHYSYALTPEEAALEAENCKSIIDESGVALELPVFFDIEDADGYKRKYNFDFSADNVQAICQTFIDKMAPLSTGVYASESWFNNAIDWEALKVPVWNASWLYDTSQLREDNDTDGIKGYMWQYTDKLFIAGKLYDGDIIYGNEF